MVDAEVQPSLSRHLALPVAAGVVVDQLLLLGHPKQLPELGTGLLELVGVVVLLDIVVLVELCDDPLRRDGGEKRSHEGRVVEQKGSTPELWSREGGKLAWKKKAKILILEGIFLKRKCDAMQKVSSDKFACNYLLIKVDYLRRLIGASAAAIPPLIINW